ncbi:SNARE-like superfamily protein [Theobroma cacao]|uniref:Coatomer subunit zeta n=1 Tax=Theobroma cacao TaxID=3641 RepID=A0A061GJD0_THECC|nr:SNARE-like superfamily protein [Theobroma cacao]
MARFFSSRDSCPAVKNILILDSEGKRVAVKYYSDEWPTNSAKLAFEKSLFTKTLKSNARTEAEITMFDSNIVIYKFVQDLHFFVTGANLALFVGHSSENTIDKREALENLDLIFLCIDEIVDQGMILETDANVLAGKVAIQNMEVSAPLSEQTISQALATAREHLTRTLLK